MSAARWKAENVGHLRSRVPGFFASRAVRKGPVEAGSEWGYSWGYEAKASLHLRPDCSDGTLPESEDVTARAVEFLFDPLVLVPDLRLRDLFGLNK